MISQAARADTVSSSSGHQAIIQRSSSGRFRFPPAARVRIGCKEPFASLH
jgi:hypothetical protein